MLRAAWLGLACLVLVSGIAAARFATSTPKDEKRMPPRKAAPIAVPSRPVPSPIEARINSNRFEAFDLFAPDKPLATEQKNAKGPVTIVSRHWHDPLEKQMPIKRLPKNGKEKANPNAR